jgi:hypothetical protein
MAEKGSMPKLEEGLLQAMNALDSQIARVMERSPAEREVYGVQKWEPYQQKTEQVATFVINSFGSNEAHLDSVLVLSQAFVKALKILSHDLGTEGLGKLRSAYCQSAAERINDDMRQLLQELRGHVELM